MKTAHASIQPVCSMHKSAHRRPRRAAVQLRRGDLAFTPPPWHQTYDATAEQLHTPDLIKVLDSQVRSFLDCQYAACCSGVQHGVCCACMRGVCWAMQECKSCEVHVSVDISPVGAGYFVSGGASADLPLQCDCCLATFWHPVAAPFEVSACSVSVLLAQCTMMFAGSTPYCVCTCVFSTSMPGGCSAKAFS